MAIGMLLPMSVMRVWIVWWTDVFHSVDAAAFGTALDGAVAGHLVGREVSERVRDLGVEGGGRVGEKEGRKGWEVEGGEGERDVR